MTKERAMALQERLTDIFTAANLPVSVGLIHDWGEWGVSIGSQTTEVYLHNTGAVRAQ